jgi:hypothetical protein
MWVSDGPALLIPRPHGSYVLSGAFSEAVGAGLPRVTRLQRQNDCLAVGMERTVSGVLAARRGRDGDRAELRRAYGRKVVDDEPSFGVDSEIDAVRRRAQAGGLLDADVEARGRPDRARLGGAAGCEPRRSCGDGDGCPGSPASRVI